MLYKRAQSSSRFVAAAERRNAESESCVASPPPPPPFRVEDHGLIQRVLARRTRYVCVICLYDHMLHIYIVYMYMQTYYYYYTSIYIHTQTVKAVGQIYKMHIGTRVRATCIRYMYRQ